MIEKGIQDVIGPKNNIMEDQLMVFFDRLELIEQLPSIRISIYRANILIIFLREVL